MPRNFIAVDGESITINDMMGRPYRQDYVLLSVGERSLHRDGLRLGHNHIFEFLYECFKQEPAATYAGFHLGYDFTHWLRSIPRDDAHSLFHPETRMRRNPHSGAMRPHPVRVDDWEIDILPNRVFRLRPRKGTTNGMRDWMHVCDAGSFFQGQSFLRVVDDIRAEHPDVCTDDEYSIIMEGKRRRTDAGFDPDMMRYNVTENAVFARVLGVLDMGLKTEPLGIHLPKDKFYSPGAAVQVFLNDRNMMTTESLVNTIDIETLEMARDSYYGGWFETMVLGTVPGTSYEYDICSAYPHIIRSLPCLCEGVAPAETGWMALVDVETREAVKGFGGPLVRSIGGTLSRRAHTRQVMWEHELIMWVKAGIVRPDYVVHKSMRFRPACDHPPPLKDFTDFYDLRRRVGKKTPLGLALKLVMNSAYGKFAQSVGNPKYSNPIWASLITSGTRCLILGAISTHPHGVRDLVMVATDGVYFRTRHKKLNVADELGAWEEAPKDRLFVFKPGIYWDLKSRADRARARGAKSRGIPLATFHEWSVDIERWGDNLKHVFESSPEVEPGVRDFSRQDGIAFTVKRPFFHMSAKQALHVGRWGDAGSIKVNEPFVARPGFSTKHQVNVYLDRGVIHFLNKDGGLFHSVPYPKAMGLGVRTEEYDDDQIGYDKETISGMLREMGMR